MLLYIYIFIIYYLFFFFLFPLSPLSGSSLFFLFFGASRRGRGDFFPLLPRRWPPFLFIYFSFFPFPLRSLHLCNSLLQTPIHNWAISLFPYSDFFFLFSPLSAYSALHPSIPIFSNFIYLFIFIYPYFILFLFPKSHPLSPARSSTGRRRRAPIGRRPPSFFSHPLTFPYHSFSIIIIIIIIIIVIVIIIIIVIVIIIIVIVIVVILFYFNSNCYLWNLNCWINMKFGVNLSLVD